MMKKTLFIMGHPHPENSLSNRLITDEMRRVEGVSVRVLTETMKNGEFDAAAEQQAIVESDIIVLQFPFYWFSTPSTLQKWFEDVLLYGFAYGTGGDSLRGKKLLVSVTVGGSKEDYIYAGQDYMAVLLQPLRALAEFTGLETADDVISWGMTYIPGVSGDKDEISSKALACQRRRKSTPNAD